MTIGEVIKKYRAKAKLTQSELATLAGIPKITLQQYERGVTKQPQVEQLQKIAKALKIRVSDLMEIDKQSKAIFLSRLSDILDRYDPEDINAAYGTYTPYDEIFSGTEPLTEEKARAIANECGVPYAWLVGEIDDDATSLAKVSDILDAYNKALVDADTVDVGLMALLIQKNQHCTLDQAEKLAEVVAKCIQVGGDSAKAALSFDRIDDAQKPAALAMLRALERNEPRK